MSVIGARALRIRGGSRPQSVLVTTSDADFFTILRAKPAIGRVFTASECQPGRDAVIVLSHGFAESQFGSPANALGNRLVLNDRNYEVIVVMPPPFFFHTLFFFFYPPARAEMTVFPDRVAQAYRKEDRGWGAIVNRLREDLVGDSPLPLLILLGA